jgi:hypothetical protein
VWLGGGYGWAKWLVYVIEYREEMPNCLISEFLLSKLAVFYLEDERPLEVPEDLLTVCGQLNFSA